MNLLKSVLTLFGNTFSD